MSTRVSNDFFDYLKDVRRMDKEGKTYQMSWVQTPEPTKVTNVHVMSQRFRDGQCVRHVIKRYDAILKKVKIGENALFGVYDSESDSILSGSTRFKSLSAMSQAHYVQEEGIKPVNAPLKGVPKPTRKSSNGWKECQYEVEGVWISCD
jgi:hypothetical protein